MKTTPDSSLHPSSNLALFQLLLWFALLPHAFSQTSAAAAHPPLNTAQQISLHHLNEEAIERAYPIWCSTQRLQRLERHFQEIRHDVIPTDFSALDQESQVDFILLRDRVEQRLHEIQRTRRHIEELHPVLPFLKSLLALLEDRHAMKIIPPRQAAEVLQQTRTSVDETQARLEKSPAPGSPPLSPVTAHRALRVLRTLQDELRSFHSFYAGFDPVMTWWIKTPQAELEESLQGLVKTVQKLEGQKPGSTEPPLVGDPLGRESLEQALRTEWICYTPEELLAIAEAEMAWCQAEWRKAASDLGFGDDWRKALDHVTQIHRQPGDQPALIVELAQEAIQFLESRDLVTIPPLCKEIWRMEMMSPERQKVNPYFTGGEIISVSFPTDTMSHEDKIMSLRGNNVHFCRATVHHELIPGHHLQLFMADRYRPHRKIFSTPFLVEGWALHWEMLLWDLGFARSAEDRVGMLFWRTHRCARILFSLRYHLGEMTAESAVDYLVRTVGHEPRNARAEVRRSIEGNYGPLYQAAYMLGGLQLRALYAEQVGQGKMTPKGFHDAVLTQNAIPIELIRAGLQGEKLRPDSRSTWKFYGSMQKSR